MEEPTPYGGVLVQSIVEEKEREQKLIDQAVEVNINGQVETLRPESIFLKGVDSLSTDNIKGFVDYYVNYEYVKVPKDTKPAEAETKEGETAEGEAQDTEMSVDDIEYVEKLQEKPFDEVLKFRVQWINDTSVNVVFETHEAAIQALKSLSISGNPNNNQEEELNELVQERETKPYNPTIEFQKKSSLANRLGLEEKKDEGMEEDETSLHIVTRLSLQSDRKIKNASAYSRYYLIHGEPERRPRYNGRGRGRGRGGRGGRGGRRNERDYDLFADKLRGEEPEDLFAEKLRNRDRSPDRDRSPMRD
ncbi:hypothetical protein CLIB1444_04S02718 [[Candida] jaroonii]|uniref:Uncharacterized protein n=1 Tax=[Candida] jaroonii TaxID=467808 RepID=A0ACA9Y6E6_9ASCO|nr:hypothetical protein CLIB1444_04S02718 [[Candida] jaroonii]